MILWDGSDLTCPDKSDVYYSYGKKETTLKRAVNFMRNNPQKRGLNFKGDDCFCYWAKIVYKTIIFNTGRQRSGTYCVFFTIKKKKKMNKVK